MGRNSCQQNVARQLTDDVANGESRLDVIELIAIEVEIFLPVDVLLCAQS